MSDQSKKTETQPEQDMRFTKRELAGFLIVVVIVALGGLAFWHMSSSKSGSAKTASVSKVPAFKIAVPTSWRPVQPPPQGTLGSFTAATADSDTTGTLKPYIDIQKSPLNSSAQKLTFDQIKTAYLTEISSDYPGYQQLATTPETIAGKPALLITFSSTAGNAAVTADSLFMVANGATYSVNGESLSSTWAQHTDDIKNALLSFQP